MSTNAAVLLLLVALVTGCSADVPDRITVERDADAPFGGRDDASDDEGDFDATDEDEWDPREHRTSANAAAMPTATTTAPRPRGHRPLPPNAFVVSQAAVMDQRGFDRPIAAGYALIPAGWQPKGPGVVWARQYSCTQGYNFEWSAASPDGAFEVAIVPMIGWSTSNYGGGSSAVGCPSLQVGNVQQLIEMMVKAGKPGARPLQFRRRPDIERPYASVNAMQPTASGDVAAWVEAGELLFAYEENGRDMRGVMIVVATITRVRTSMSMGQDYVGINGFSVPGFVATAPNGQLDFARMEAVRQSWMPNPEWELAIHEHRRKLGAQQLAALRERARLWKETNDYVSKVRQQGWESRQRSNERSAALESRARRGVEEYVDPNVSSGTVELSNLYDHAYALRDGSYLLTNDANFDPVRDAGLDARRLEQMR